MIDKLINLANHLDEKGLQKEADYLDSILKKLASESDEETVITLSEEEFYRPEPTQREFTIKYEDWEPSWDQAEWYFTLNGEEVSFTTLGSTDTTEIADRLADAVGIKAGIASKEQYGPVEWYFKDHAEIIFDKLSPYVNNIERLKKDIADSHNQF